MLQMSSLFKDEDRSCTGTNVLFMNDKAKLLSGGNGAISTSDIFRPTDVREKHNIMLHVNPFCKDKDKYYSCTLSITFKIRFLFNLKWRIERLCSFGF